MSTERRGGYNEVWMDDPRMSFRHEHKRITLSRISGGGVMFSLMKTTDLIKDLEYTRKYIRTEEQFEKLWDFLIGLK